MGAGLLVLCKAATSHTFKLFKSVVSSFRNECGARIRLSTTDDGECLVVKEICLEHNHPIDKTVFQNMPKKRRLPPQIRDYAKVMLSLGGNKKKIQQHLMGLTGKVVTIKDLHNMSAEDAANAEEMSVEDVTSLLQIQPASSNMSKKLLLDVDCGVDDAQAIMLALAAPNVEILGITCVHGNTSVENVCKNTLRVLQACKKLEIPVFKGASKPILGNQIEVGHFHGLDGLGDSPDPNAPSVDMIQKEGAVSAMIRIINEHPGEVSLVATAPLTNLAFAVRMEPSFPSKLKGLYIMGGNTESRGNTTVCGEFNFAADPEAAYIVLNDYQCPIYLACWEFTCYNKLSWEFCDQWLAQDSEKARFMARIFKHSLDLSKTEEVIDDTGLISCDSYAVAAAVDEAFILETDQFPVSVELTGTHTRGMMVVDTVGFMNKTQKAFIMKKVNLEKFKQMMMAALK
ncbi:inosine-uridine preferring nucleoside hydrolase-like isoform X2 [Eucyclogobius newberryi]|uniref:inosine-uridine preferring nucleoside hydrolase-like isoform X2 n=1 Tax=Eucyclogobius newberryi TaxID=166745 RepID=UPI003B59A96F